MDTNPAPCPVPLANRLVFLFGLALLEQKFTPEQAALYMRRALEATKDWQPPATTRVVRQNGRVPALEVVAAGD
ncbi:MAG: hypothetical protein IT318_24000 [Anaerolineales bacterium]|nr:hypothetical protein [Anaerolineales bacterium]